MIIYIKWLTCVFGPKMAIKCTKPTNFLVILNTFKSAMFQNMGQSTQSAIIEKKSSKIFRTRITFGCNLHKQFFSKNHFWSKIQIENFQIENRKFRNFRILCFSSELICCNMFQFVSKSKTWIWRKLQNLSKFIQKRFKTGKWYF